MLLTSVGTHPILKRPPGSPQIPFMEVIFKLFSGDVFNVGTLLDIKESPTVPCGGYNVQYVLQHKFGQIKETKRKNTLTIFELIFWAVGVLIWHRRPQVDAKLPLKRPHLAFLKLHLSKTGCGMNVSTDVATVALM